MSVNGWLQIGFFVGILTLLTPVLGTYMAKVYSGERVFLTPILAPVERLFYRAVGTSTDRGQDWKSYARSVLVFSALSWLLLYLILRTQGIQPFNPEGFASAPWDVTFNTTSSFVTNTNWQFYGGETTLSYFSQMVGLAVQNFVSAAVGMAVLVAVIRGIVSRGGHELGQLLGRPDPLAPLHPAADLDRRRALPRLPGGRPDARRLPRHLDARRRAAGNRASALPPRRSRSSSSAPTAAASSTSTPRCRSRTRPR